MLLPLLTLFLACDPSGPGPEGLAPTEHTGGPVVVWDIEAQPLPEIPLPNDAATRLDPSTATGRRLNISEDAPTAYERETRAKFNKLDGFGTFAPIMVSFDAPLDIAGLLARHADDRDFTNDAIYLLNVDPGCDRYGEEIALDIGLGRFPVTHLGRGEAWTDAQAPGGYGVDHEGVYFAFDEHSETNNLLFEERWEDQNGDGVLDPGEDIDGDGVLDEPNFLDPHACRGEILGTPAYDRCVADNLLTFYERESNTLILWPLWPMEQRCTHAVVLTERLTGEFGSPVSSPFAAINPREQTQDLEPVLELLGGYGLGVEDVGFTWSFTTGSMSTDMEALREGLYGSGPFAQLAEEFPVQSFRPWTRGELMEVMDGEADPAVADEHLLPGACSGLALTWLWGQALEEWPPNMCAIEADLSSLGGLFGGSFTAPDLLVDKQGGATAAYPGTHDENWEVDPEAGTATYGETEVTFWCALPIEKTQECAPGNPEGMPFCKPFPVVNYGHGYGGSRAEITLHIGRHTAMGYALCSLDYYGHGLNRWIEDPTAATAMAFAQLEFERDTVPELAPLIMLGRDRDLDNDGYSDSGADMWTADVFHTRDMVRQSALEASQFVRILRHMDGETQSADGGLLGDIDGDGSVELGGPENTIGYWGISLGGVVSGVVAGSEPSLDAVSPNAGGAALSTIAVRSKQTGVPAAVVMPMLGPVIAGCIPADEHQRALPVGEPGGDCADGEGSLEGPYTGGQLRLMMLAENNASIDTLEFATVDGVEPGDRVVLENLANGETKEMRVNERGWFRLAVAADALDAIERRPLLGLDGDEAGSGSVEDNTTLGDPLRLTVYAGDSDTVREVVDSFHHELSFEGTEYAAGSTLVALQEGMGFRRNTPDLRRFMAIAQHALCSADPGMWAGRVHMEPLDVGYDPYTRGGNTRVLYMPTTGDHQVPVHTGVAMARAGGALGSWKKDSSIDAAYGWRELFVPDERYGVSPDQYLVDTWVIEGDDRLQRYLDNPGNPNALFDVDDVSDGAAAFSCGPSDWSAIIGENECPEHIDGQEIFFGVPAGEHPLRQDIEREGGGYDSLRIPLLRPAGQHGIYNAQSFRVFDADAFMVNHTVRFLGSRGGIVEHEPGCDCSASGLPLFLRDGEPQYPGLEEACTEDDLKLCEASCAEAWGLETPEVAECVTR